MSSWFGEFQNSLSLSSLSLSLSFEEEDADDEGGVSSSTDCKKFEMSLWSTQRELPSALSHSYSFDEPLLALGFEEEDGGGN